MLVDVADTVLYLLSSSTTSTSLQHMTATHSICSISRGNFCRNADDKDQKWKRWRRAKSGEKNRPSSDGDLSPTDMHIHLGNEECRKHFTPAFHSTFTPFIHLSISLFGAVRTLQMPVLTLPYQSPSLCLRAYVQTHVFFLIVLTRLICCFDSAAPAISSGLKQLSVDKSYRSTKSDIAK